MNRKLRLHRPLAVALALVLGTGEALALGLGQVEVKSSLYEPLEAEIPVLSSTPGEAEALTVRLASPEAFARVGLDRPPATANLQFSVVENARGQKVIRITTPSRVNDPFLSFLIEADWGRGRLLREFTVLLDPPTTAPARAAASAPVREAAPAPAPVERPRPAAPAPAETAPAAEAPVARTEPVAPAPSAPEPAPAPAAAAPSGDYTVAAGDTLWSVAQRLRPAQGVSVNQMMVALLNSNPDAFIDGNINLLKRGAILRMPDSDALAAQSAAEAAALVREQMDAWRGRQAPQPQPAEPEPSSIAPAPSRPREADSRLELVPPRGEQPAEGARSGVDAQSGAGTELRAELARAREDLGARDQEISELRSRVQELESIRDDSQRLLQMKDSELATLQRRLAELEAQRQAEQAAAASAPAAGTEPASAPDAPPADATAAIDTTTTGEDPATADAEPPAATDQQAAADQQPAAGQPPTATGPAGEQVTAPLAEPEPSPAEPLPAREGLPWYRNPWLLGGLGVIVLGLLVWLLRGRGRGGEAAAGGPGTRGYDSGALAAAVPGTAAATAVAAAPSADDRESALLDALAEQPEELDRHLDLVRYYYELGDADAFEGAAEAMYAQVYDPDDLRWKQVVAMGRELLPDHPLFLAPLAAEDLQGDAGAVDAEQPSGGQDWETGSWSAQAFDAGEPPPAPAAELDDSAWDMPQEETPPEAGAQADTASTQQFRFEDLETEAARERAAPSSTPTPPVEPAAEPETAPASFEYGGDDAASTKLELARAYLDMGDVEGARGMLEEVMGEGNAGQRAEARRLLDEIR